MKKLLALMLAMVMVVACFAACGETKDKGDADAFKIGAVGPLTGDTAIYGTAAMNGAKIAVDEINEKGDIKIEFKDADDVGDGETSVNAYNSLLDWGMQILMGPVTSGAGIAVSSEAYEDRVFCLTPSASSTDVIDGKDNMYQVCFTDPNQGTGSADYMAENHADAKIAVIYRNDDPYSQGIRDTFVKEAEVKGLDVVYEGTFTKDTATDFSVQLTAAKAEGADMIYLPIYYQPASVIFKQAADMDYAPTYFGVDGMDGILTMPGFNAELAEGVMLLTPFSADAADEKTQNFVKTYKEKYGEVPNQFAADAYDAIYILAEALQTAECTPDMEVDEICEKLIAEIQKMEFDGLTGQDMTWKATGEVSKAPMAVVIENGEYVLPEAE